jgi:hypothetical protein
LNSTYDSVLTARARYWAAALMIASALGACLTSFTTAWLFVHHRPQMTVFEEALKLPQNPFFIARAWAQPVHVFCFFLSVSAVIALTWQRARALSATALLCMILWAVFALTTAAIELFAVPAWRVQFAGAPEAVQAQLRTLITGAQTVQGAVWFLSSVAMVIAMACLGAVFIRDQTRWVRWMGFSVAAVAATLLVVMITRYRGDWHVFDIAALWVLPAVQVLSRAMLATWLCSAHAVAPGVRSSSVDHVDGTISHNAALQGH